MERDYYMAKQKFCSFCNNEITIDNLGIEGLNACICFDCLDLYHKLVEFQEEEQKRELYKFEVNQITPKSIYLDLEKEVIGQQDAKKTLSVALYLHYLRITNPSLHLEKSNILMIGPTGTGKTHLAKTMAKILKVPLAICDATVYTQAGYVGEDVENILLRLIQNADYDISLAEKGIVFIDEFDKLARKGENPSITRDVSGEGVQNALLKIIEGNIVNVPPQGGRKHPYQECLKIDTTNILFICAGAFEGLEGETKYSVGFNSSKINDEINYLDKIRKYGIIPELLGRLPIIARLNELTASELKQILTIPSNAIIKQYQNIFKICDVELAFLDNALDEVAAIAIKEKTGARSLKKIVEEMMLDTLFELPLNDGTKIIEINQNKIIKRKEKVINA